MKDIDFKITRKFLKEKKNLIKEELVLTFKVPTSLARWSLDTCKFETIKALKIHKYFFEGVLEDT